MFAEACDYLPQKKKTIRNNGVHVALDNSQPAPTTERRSGNFHQSSTTPAEMAKNQHHGNQHGRGHRVKLPAWKKQLRKFLAAVKKIVFYLCIFNFSSYAQFIAL
jgi:hypothetical protein